MGFLHDLGQAAGHVLNAAPGYSTLGANITNPDVNYKGAYNPPTPSNGGFVAPTTKVAAPAATPAATPTNTTTTTAPTGGAAAPVLNQGAVTNTQLAINQIAPLLQAALASEGTNYANTTGALDAQQAAQQKTYDSSTVTNQGNYDSNFMDSIRAGIKGLGSLMQILRGSGAAGGTAENNVKDVVGGTTSDDIRTGADTQKTNQASLDTTLSSFLTDLKSKRAANDDTHANNDAAITRDSNTQLQNLYGQMAGYFGDANDTAQRDQYMSAAGSLTPQIAQDSKTQTTPYDTTPIPVTAPQLTAFAAPTQPNVATAPQDGQVGSGIFTISKPKKDDTTTPQVTAPVAAAAGA